MKYILISLLLLISSALFAQDSPKEHVYSSSLNIGEMLNFGSRSLKFKTVVSDSRCPKDVSCVWAGEATVSVEVYQDGKCIEEKLITVQPTSIPVEFTVGNIIYSIRALSLTPYPTVNKNEGFKNYVLQMSVRETMEI